MNEWMDEIPMDEAFSNLIVLQDEDGNDVEFAFLGEIEHNEARYAVLMPINDFDGEVVILQVVEGENEDEEQFLSVQDEETLDEIFQIFKEQFADAFNFTDEE